MNRILFLLWVLSIYAVSGYGQCVTNVDFNTWIEEGNPANGDWVPGGGGTLVNQNINTPEPTFFVSPDTFINVVIQGSITPPSGDDDFIGFVFGYKEPLGNSTNYDCWLFDWKQGTQTANGYTAQEGKSVNHIQGNIIDVWQYFWGHTNNPPLFDVVATDWGAGKGWVDNVTYFFTLVYTTSRVVIVIDADTIFDIAGCFEPGRFGFYNFSQANVTYADFDYSLKAYFDVLTPQVCAGDTGQFQYIDTSCSNLSGSISSWNWDFGDGNTGTDVNPSHAYVNSGIYQVQLTITDNQGCQDSVTKSLVTTSPTAIFSGAQVCMGNPTGFTDLSGISGGDSIVSWDWDFGDGNFSTVQNPSNLYGNYGTFNITLAVTSDSGCADSAVLPVQVFAVPSAGFAANGICLYDSVFFTNTSTINNGGITSWNWNFGNGNTSTTQNPWHLFSTDGNYNVTLIVTSDSSCTDTIVQSVQVYPAPTAGFSSTSVCFGIPTTFTDQSSVNSITWNWIFGDGTPVSGVQNPTHTYTDPADSIYNVTLIVTTSNGCSDNITTPVYVFPVPVANFTNDTVCLNEPSQFTDASTVANGSLSSWQWDFGDFAGSSTNKNPAYTYGSDGSYLVLLTVASNNGCTHDTTRQIAVYALPTADFNNTTVCPDFATDFINYSSVDVISWEWDFDDGGSSIASNPSNIYDAGGPYDVQLIVINNNGCSATIIKPVTAHPEPTVDFSFTPATTTMVSPFVTFLNNSIGADIYQWDLGDGISTSQAYPSFTYKFDDSDTGTYAVQLIAENSFGCLDSITRFVVIEADHSLFVPSSFSPNGDGINDTFYSKGIGIPSGSGNESNFQMIIYNRWGDQIYKTNDINQPWDGKANNGKKIAHNGVYIWIIKTNIKQGEVEKKHQYMGHVTLIK